MFVVLLPNVFHTNDMFALSEKSAEKKTKTGRLPIAHYKQKPAGSDLWPVNRCIPKTNVARVASVLLLDEESDALLKINDVFIKIQNTNTLDVKKCPQSCLLFWSGYEGHRSSFRPWVKRRAAVWSVISPRRTRLQLRRESQRCYGGHTEWSIYSWITSV